MHPTRVAPFGAFHLRLVFTDRVRSVPLAADATLQDVARAIRQGRRRAGSNPIAIAITWPEGAMVTAQTA